MGQEFIDALSERARNGVNVTVVVDAIGSFSLWGRRVARLRAAGVRIQSYQALRWYSLHRINNRTHRELLIVDGHVAFAGVALGYLLGISPVGTALVASVLGAVAIEWLRSKRQAAGDQALALLFYTGLLAQQPRSAVGLAALLGDYFHGVPVAIEQFVGQWLALDPDSLTSLRPFGGNNALGVQGNLDLFLNTVNWLAQQEDLIAIRPREAQDRRLSLTADDQTRIMWLSLFVIPGLMFAAGVYTWWQRR